MKKIKQWNNEDHMKIELKKDKNIATLFFKKGFPMNMSFNSVS